MEHEIIGHTKKVFRILKNPGKSFWDKSKEILIEILIIVFAVSFAAFIERTREHYKEKEEAKEFLIGLKGDLANEITYLKTSNADMDTVIINYTKFMKLKVSAVDSLEKTSRHINFNIPKFNSQLENGRYDGFKSSGKIQTIANNSLRNDILTLYQEDIPFLTFAEGAFNEGQTRLEGFILDQPNNAGTKQTDVIKLLTTTKAKLLLKFSIDYCKGVKEGYDNALKQAEKVQGEIDKEYK
jgi:hypothetical protein